MTRYFSNLRNISYPHEKISVAFLVSDDDTTQDATIIDQATSILIAHLLYARFTKHLAVCDFRDCCC